VGSNHSAASFLFSLVAPVGPGETGMEPWPAAFSIFFGLEVMNFDLFVFLLFLCFVLHITFQLFVVSVVSVAPNST